MVPQPFPEEQVYSQSKGSPSDCVFKLQMCFQCLANTGPLASNSTRSSVSTFIVTRNVFCGRRQTLQAIPPRAFFVSLASRYEKVYYRLIFVPWKTFGDMSAPSLQVYTEQFTAFTTCVGVFSHLAILKFPEDDTGRGLSLMRLPPCKVPQLLSNLPINGRFLRAPYHI